MTPHLLCALLLFLVFADTGWRNFITFARPVAIRDVSGIEVPPPEILRFMRRFGYLEQIPPNSEALYHESAIIEAIKKVQMYGALEQTGRLDNETLSLFTKPRCGVPDLEGTPYYLTANPTTRRDGRRGKRYVIGSRTWTKRRIRYFIANWSLKIPAEQVESDIARALALWAKYSGLHFERANDTAADIIFGFGRYYHGDNYPFDGVGNILAHAFYPYEMGSWGGDVHFDEDENWNVNSTEAVDSIDFYSVAAHELGHSLGLAHSTVVSSIMFPYYKDTEQDTLDADDTLAMYEAYVSKRLEDDEDPVVSTTDATTPEYVENHETATEEQPPFTVSPTFQGDYESITEHRNRYAFTNTPLSTVPSWPQPALSHVPNICAGSFDAVAVLNGSVYIFKREYVWKLTERYTVRTGYPRSIYNEFPFLPTEVKRINAAYERYDGAAVFFTGQRYWVFYANQLIEDSPKPLANLLGNDEELPASVDAAMMWPKNNFTYIFSGAKFWRYNDRTKMMDEGYPKSMRRWPGILNNIDAAATLTNGKTYFFKDNFYWLYNNSYVRPERGYPRRAGTAWLGCSTPSRTPLRNFNTTVSFIPPLMAIQTP